jgi:hypothetical protein
MAAIRRALERRMMISRPDFANPHARAALAGAAPSSIALAERMLDEPLASPHIPAGRRLWAHSIQAFREIMRGCWDAGHCTRVFFALSLGLGLLLLPGVAQQSTESPDDKYPGNPPRQENTPSKPARLGRLPIEWIIGPYIPVRGQLEPLSNAQRGQIYIRQTFLSAGPYVARAFSAGIDQVRGEPRDWGGGSAGYGRRYAARYGEFVVQSSILAGGNALLGFEPRYDFCRCDGFWPRTRHAISRNFVAYNRRERDLRPQVPMYVGAFAAGMVYNSWLPGQHNMWRGGAYSVLSQAGIGSGYNFVSEFALDILHAFGLKKGVTRAGVCSANNSPWGGPR